MAADAIGDDELASWLRLTETPGVGPATCRKLLAAFGMPDAILSAHREQLLRVVPSALADALRAPMSGALEALIARTSTWMRDAGNHYITLADARYPKALLETVDPPTVLYVKGRVELFDASLLAIVGSRNATTQGAIDARRFAEALARAGHVIVSGLALGIDAAAHEGALAAGSDGASTIAVIGTGADIVYPASHRTLAHRIAEAGAIVSELPVGTAASAHQFPRRNRIIAGLSRGVLVMEAAARSGSLITARLASESGRDVFAVPGSIHSPLSKGCHQLIRQGAKLVDSVDDILEELKSSFAPSPHPQEATRSPPDDDPLATALGFDPVTTDELVERSGLNPAQLSALLLDLELAGRVERLPGGRFQRLAPQ
jgi:DNA processing protein